MVSLSWAKENLQVLALVLGAMATTVFAISASQSLFDIQPKVLPGRSIMTQVTRSPMVQKISQMGPMAGAAPMQVRRLTSQVHQGTVPSRSQPLEDKAQSWPVALAAIAAVATTFFAGMVIGRKHGESMAMAATISAPDLQLFGNQGSRSPLVNWYLYEIDCEFQNIDVSGVDRNSASYPHPFGKIPALRDGPLAVFESGAILLYLADKYGGLDTPEKRAEAASWVVWANATLDPICFVENDRGGVIDTKLRGRPKAIDTLDAILGERQWILGDQFSVADVAIASYLLYVLLFFPKVEVAKWPNMARYMEACAMRPAYALAFGSDTAQVLAARCRKRPGTFGLF